MSTFNGQFLHMRKNPGYRAHERSLRLERNLARSSLKTIEPEANYWDHLGAYTKNKHDLWHTRIYCPGHETRLTLLPFQQAS
jgi:hypothetical protein